MSAEPTIHDAVSSIIRNELLRSWHEGMRDGLKMAHLMVQSLCDEAERRCAAANAGSEHRRGLEAQIAVLSGLTSSLATAAAESAESADNIGAASDLKGGTSHDR